jgi:hypothetical protein
MKVNPLVQVEQTCSTGAATAQVSTDGKEHFYRPDKTQELL